MEPSYIPSGYINCLSCEIINAGRTVALLKSRCGKAVCVGIDTVSANDKM